MSANYTQTTDLKKLKTFSNYQKFKQVFLLLKKPDFSHLKVYLNYCSCVFCVCIFKKKKKKIGDG